VTGTEASEPELSPAYVAMHEAYQRLTALERTNKRRQSILAAMAVEQERLDGFRSRLTVEKARLDVAEARARRRPMLPRARRRRETEAAWHRKVVDAIRSELDARQPAFEELSVSLGPAPGFDLGAELEAAQGQLDIAIDAWHSVHRESGSTFSAWLHVSERYSGEIEALLIEVEEAAGLARVAKAALHLADRAILRASASPGWSTVERATKGRQGDSEALEWSAVNPAVARFRRHLLQLDTELRDLHRPSRAELAPPSSLLVSLDDWFGGPFAPWLAQGSLDLPRASLVDGRDQFDVLEAELLAYRRSLRQRLSEVQQVRLNRLLEHPGVV